MFITISDIQYKSGILVKWMFPLSLLPARASEEQLTFFFDKKNVLYNLFIIVPFVFHWKWGGKMRRGLAVRELDKNIDKPSYLVRAKEGRTIIIKTRKM